MFTGLRLGELLGLKWEDIDFRGGLLYVRRSLNRVKKDKEDRKNGCATEVVTQSPKTQNSIRSIPLLGGMLDELNEWKRVQATDALAAGGQYSSSGFVVTNPKGGFIEPRAFREYYSRILNAAKLQHFTFHALRHTFATRALEQGMDAKTLSVILGHYSVSFTLDTYAHVLNDHKREEMALMEELLCGDAQHEKQAKNMGLGTNRKVIPIPV